MSVVEQGSMAKPETIAVNIATPAPIAKRRWENFRSNKRGYYSAWIFGFLFILSMGAEFMANDKPIIVKFDGGYYFPFLTSYPETVFGGEFPTEAVYLDPYVQDLVAEKGWMLWPPVRFSHDTLDMYLPGAAPSGPSLRHPFGTDDAGEDVLAKVLYGFRLSITFGVVLTFCSAIIGITVGAVQGFFGGWVDLVGQRLVELWAGMPILFLLIILSSLIDPSPYWLFGLLLLFSWMPLVGVVRAEFLRARNYEYVRAARALGLDNSSIMLKHVLPNAMVAALTLIPIMLTGSVILLTALDFLGFGLPMESPSLGRLIQQGKSNIEAPWLGLTAFFSLSILLTLLVFIGEAFRDAFDPRKALT